LSNITVRYLASSEYEMWDEFVGISPQGTIFSSSLWLRLSGFSFRILACLDGNDNLIGGLAFVEKKVGRIKIITSPPLTPFQGILLKNDSQAKRSRQISRHINVVTSIIRRLEVEHL